MIGQLAVVCGGEIVASETADDVTAHGSDNIDLLIVVGGSGTGLRDISVHLLAQAGQVAFHGVGIGPGETVALGKMNQTAVLVVPGRLDAAFAAWATIGEAMMARLSGGIGASPSLVATLTRKVTSTIGLVEIVPVKLESSNAQPLASGYIPMQTMAQADGYIVVPADCEGFQAGTVVNVRVMP
jgi:molybdopterin molybdotransferase